ncbi:hypothetical protein GQ44DRAFT_699182 [Phaeosphaeriaceae sp. PMI808]|nr:hypothetical protein GQ44DRAFT_699182 [Phaeosphaeriaceae sp. PMI808]
MHSSADEDEMFPDEALPNNPATPINASIQNLAAPDLSPPNSQGPAVLARDTSTLSSAVNANGKRPLSLAHSVATIGTHTDAETGYTWSRPEDQPGFEWRNARAREDQSRAMDQIVDLAAQIKTKYGDPLDANASAKTKR